MTSIYVFTYPFIYRSTYIGWLSMYSGKNHCNKIITYIKYMIHVVPVGTTTLSPLD